MNKYRIDELQDVFDSFEIVVPHIPPPLIEAQEDCEALKKTKNPCVMRVLSSELEEKGLQDVYFEIKNNFCKEKGRFWKSDDIPFIFDMFFFRTNSQYNVVGGLEHRFEDGACAVDWVWIHPYLRNRRIFTNWAEVQATMCPIFLTPPVSPIASHVISKVMDQADPAIKGRGIECIAKHVKDKRGIDISNYPREEMLTLALWSHAFSSVSDIMEEAGGNHKKFNDVLKDLFASDVFIKKLLEKRPQQFLKEEAQLMDLFKEFIDEKMMKEFEEVTDEEAYDKFVHRVKGLLNR